MLASILKIFFLQDSIFCCNNFILYKKFSLHFFLKKKGEGTSVMIEMQQQEIFLKNTSRQNFGIAIIFFFASEAVNIMFIVVVQKSHLHIHSELSFEK